MANYLDKTGLTLLWNKVKNDIAGKQNTLTFDTTPTASSTNPVTSNGIYTALSGKAATATTLAGYGITDAYTQTQLNTLFNAKLTFKDEYISDCNKFTTMNGYAKCSANIPTKNLPSLCTGTDRWGIIFFIAENTTNGTGTQFYYPIDGTYKGQMFTRALTNMNATASAGNWYLVCNTNNTYLKTEIDTKFSALTVPTKTSQLTNDSGFITTAALLTKTSQLTNDSGFITSTSLPTKTSQLTNDSGYLTSIDLPTKTSQLTNDSGFLTAHQDISGKADKATTLSGYGITDVYTKTEMDSKVNLKADITAIPTKNSQLTNDSSFITNAANDLVNYYLKNDIYTKAEVTNLLGGFKAAIIKIVDVLPTTGETNIIYFVPRSTGGIDGDSYTEYAWISGKFEKIGSTDTVDLTNYYNKGDIDIKLADYIKITDVDAQLVNYAKKTDVDTEVTTGLAKKVNIDGTTPMSYLDVGDRKAGSVVGKHSVVEGGDKALIHGSNTIDISNIASGDYSHAEGVNNRASSLASHAEGGDTTASGVYSHAEGGGTTASGDYSHAGGYNTKASSSSQTAIGEYNIEDVEGNNLLIVGNGTSDTDRSDAFVVGIDGSATVSTKLKCQGITDSKTYRTVSISNIQEALYKGVKTIATTDWTNKQTTVTVSLPASMKLERNGVSTFISAAPESYSDYAKFGVYCSAERGSTLTFTCSKVPTVDLNVNILVQYYLIQV